MNTENGNASRRSSLNGPRHGSRTASARRASRRTFPTIPLRATKREPAAGRCSTGRTADLRALTDLLVPEAISRAIEPEQIEALVLRAREASAHPDAIAGPERAGRDADGRQFPEVIHLEAPGLRLAGVGPAIGDVDDEERMRVDELELRDDALERHPAAAVVDA